MLTPTASSPFLDNIFQSALSDNQTGELIWNYPDPPHPNRVNSCYRRIGCVGDGSCLFHTVLKAVAPFYLKTYQPVKRISEEQLAAYERIVGRELFSNYLFSHHRRNDRTAEYGIINQDEFNSVMAEFRRLYALRLRSDFVQLIKTNSQMKDLIQKYHAGSIEILASSEAIRRKPSLAQNPNELTNYLQNNPDLFEIGARTVENDLIYELQSGGPVRTDLLLLLSEYNDFDFYLLRDIDLINGDLNVSPLYGGKQLHASVLGPQDLRLETDLRKSFPNRPAIIIISFNDNHYELIGRLDFNADGRDISFKFDQTEPIVRLLYSILLRLGHGRE